MPRVLSEFGVRMSIILPLQKCDELAERIKKGPQFPFSDQATHEEWVNDKIGLINIYSDLVTGLLDEFEVNGQKFKEITTNHLGQPNFRYFREWLQEHGSRIFEAWESRN